MARAGRARADESRTGQPKRRSLPGSGPPEGASPPSSPSLPGLGGSGRGESFLTSASSPPALVPSSTPDVSPITTTAPWHPPPYPWRRRLRGCRTEGSTPRCRWPCTCERRRRGHRRSFLRANLRCPRRRSRHRLRRLRRHWQGVQPTIEHPPRNDAYVPPSSAATGSAPGGRGRVRGGGGRGSRTRSARRVPLHDELWCLVDARKPSTELPAGSLRTSVAAFHEPTVREGAVMDPRTGRAPTGAAAAVMLTISARVRRPG